MSEPILLGGRAFRPLIESTLEHDIWTMNQLTGLGLPEAAPVPGEEIEDFARRVILKAAEQSKTFLLLGGLLVPDGVRWSPDVARETAEQLKRLTDPAEKNQVLALIGNVVADFFAQGAALLMTSRRYSEIKKAVPRQSGKEEQSASAHGSQ